MLYAQRAKLALFIRGVGDKLDVQNDTTVFTGRAALFWLPGLTYPNGRMVIPMEKRSICRGEIYVTHPNPVRGSEQGGTRPCLIIQNNIGNRHSSAVIIAPITGKTKKHLPTHAPISAPRLPLDSTTLLEQIRTIDRRRLGGYIGKISEVQMRAVEKAIDVSLGLGYLEDLTV